MASYSGLCRHPNKTSLWHGKTGVMDQGPKISCKSSLTSAQVARRSTSSSSLCTKKKRIARHIKIEKGLWFLHTSMLTGILLIASDRNPIPASLSKEMDLVTRYWGISENKNELQEYLKLRNRNWGLDSKTLSPSIHLLSLFFSLSWLHSFLCQKSFLHLAVVMTSRNSGVTSLKLLSHL